MRARIVAGVAFVLSCGFWQSPARAEIENESLPSPLDILDNFHFLGDVHFEKTLRTLSQETGRPLRWPNFRDPYEGMDDELIEAEVKPLVAWSRVNIPSHLSNTIPAVRPIFEDNTVEVYLPENRCDVGFIKWGSADSGYFKCRILGRGQAVFGNLRDMAGLKKQVRDYRTWILGKLPAAVTEEELKPQEHFSRGPTYDHCLYRPEEETNGASISLRPDSSIGQFLLETGPRIHPGKEAWGSYDGGSGNRYILPVRMNKISDSRNEKYKNNGRLIYRDDFFVHAHFNRRDAWPLQSQSTWGCPRLSRACMVDFGNWVSRQNARGLKPRLVQANNSERASNFDRE